MLFDNPTDASMTVSRLAGFLPEGNQFLSERSECRELPVNRDKLVIQHGQDMRTGAVTAIV
jgi:hypothetical protein